MNYKGTEGNWKVLEVDESWKVKDNTFVALVQSFEGDERFIIADEPTKKTTKEKMIANADLIANAYELLKACNFAKQNIIHGEFDEITLNVLENAISKALGKNKAKAEIS